LQRRNVKHVRALAWQPLLLLLLLLLGA